MLSRIPRNALNWRSYPDNTHLTHTFEPSIIQKPRGAGEADLVRLSRALDDETDWLYVEGTWFCITESVINHATRGDRRVIKRIHHLSEFGECITDYHTHPATASKIEYERTVREKKAQGEILSQQDRTALALELDLGYSLPSVIDIFGGAATIVGNTSCKIDFGIASKTGIVRMQLHASISLGMELADIAEQYGRAVLDHSKQLSRGTKNPHDTLCHKMNQEMRGLIQLDWHPYTQ